MRLNRIAWLPAACLLTAYLLSAGIGLGQEGNSPSPSPSSANGSPQPALADPASKRVELAQEFLPVEHLLGQISSGDDTEPGSSWLAAVWSAVQDVWNYVITTVDNSPITVGKIVTGILLLLFGFIISRFLSRAFGRRLLGRLKVNESATAALQSVVFYLLLVVFVIIALRFANVPLTAFTILGGAVALGVGFGSQNIINNFISGLILLAERPIRVGDMVQLDDLYGTVTKIGARSTWVRTGENLEIVVPNSSFLESNVINWTLSDDKQRARVNVGVIYGSPTREVARLLVRAAAEHGLILHKPEPFVWFVDFGDNSLNFQLHFWIRAKTLAERMRIESDIRFRIDHLFRDAKIVIAFPQRDVHLDADQPLPIQLVASETDELEEEPIAKRD